MRAVEVEVSLPRPRGRSLIFSPISALNPVFLELLVFRHTLDIHFVRVTLEYKTETYKTMYLYYIMSLIVYKI